MKLEKLTYEQQTKEKKNQKKSQQKTSKRKPDKKPKLNHWQITKKPINQASPGH